MLKYGSEEERSIKKGPSIWHECLDATLMLLMEMRDTQENKYVYVE